MSKTDALKSIPFKPLSLSIERLLPYYILLLNIRKKRGKLIFSNISPIEIFKRFIYIIIIRLVVISINVYTK
jgi:hypothetical protein